MNRKRGFTLIELLVTVTVLAILVSVGIPSMIDFARNNRRAAATNLLVTDVQRARSSAASTGRNSVLCHSSSGTACSGDTTPDWSEGWMLFSDVNSNGTYDSGVDTLLSRGAPLDGVVMSSNVGSFTFKPSIRAMSGGFGGTIDVCIEGPNNDRQVVVSSSGRPRLASYNCP